MKFIVLSDIHGSAAALTESLKLMENIVYDRILILGDILNHGPRNPLPESYNPPLVAEMLNKMKEKIIAIQGNCDSEVDQMLLDFPILNGINTIPLEKRALIMTHGHVYTPDKIKNIAHHDIYLSGHTHIPLIDRSISCICFNPGSISLPKENHPSTLGLIDTNQLTILTLKGDVYKKLELN